MVKYYFYPYTRNVSKHILSEDGKTILNVISLNGCSNGFCNFPNITCNRCKYCI